MDSVVSSFDETPSVLPFPSLPVLQAGEYLEPGGVYLDLSRPERGPFVALHGQVSGSGNRYIAKRDVSCPRWWRLVRAAALGRSTFEEPRTLTQPAVETAIWYAADTALIGAAP